MEVRSVIVKADEDVLHTHHCVCILEQLLLTHFHVLLRFSQEVLKKVLTHTDSENA